MRIHKKQVQRTVLSVRQYKQVCVHTLLVRQNTRQGHLISGNQNSGTSYLMHSWSLANILLVLSMSSPQKISPLGTRTQASADLAVSSSGARVQLEEKIALQLGSVGCPDMNLLVAEQ